jgi:hypothetical protein
MGKIICSFRSPKEIIARLGKTGLKVKPGSEQARSILNAHDAKLLKDAKDLKDAKELKTVEDLKILVRSLKIVRI